MNSTTETQNAKLKNSKRALVCVLSFAFCILSFRSAPAETLPTTGPLRLTWQDCVKLAARNNPTLVSALEALEASQANYKGSFNGLLPHLSIANSYNQSSFTQSIGANGSLSSNATQWEIYGNASLDVVDLSQWASIANADAVMKESVASVKVAANDTLLGLYQAFANLLYAQEEVIVNSDIRDTRKTNAEMVALRYESGAESKGDSMNTQAQLTQAEAGVVQSGRDVLVAQQELSRQLGLDHFNTLIVTGTWTTSNAPMPAPDFEGLVANIPQIQLQQAMIDQARAAVKTAHSTLWPTLSINYSRGRQGTTEFPTQPFWNFSGLASYPLFGNGLTYTYYAGQAADRTYEKTKQDLRNLHNQTLSTLVGSWSGFAQAHDQVLVQQAFLDAASQRKQEYDILYRSGLQTFEEWILVVQDYVNAQVGFLKSQQNLLLAEAQWRFSTGEQLGD